MKAVFDTNILIDFLQGSLKAKEELSKYDSCLISIVTWMEVMVGAKDGKQQETLREFLSGFTVCHLDAATAEVAVKIRREKKLRLPDAIILATSRELGCLLVTKNTRDFHKKIPGIRIPY